MVPPPRREESFMKAHSSAEAKVKGFYDGVGWADIDGHSVDADLWEDLRPVARRYVSNCRLRILDHLPRAGGEGLLDAASGPVQYPEYLLYSRGFAKRFCVDLSSKALVQARQRLGDHGEYLNVNILELPFRDDFFDAAVSLHTIYHIDMHQQEMAVRELLRVTRRGGLLIIVYANPHSLFQVLRLPLVWFKSRRRHRPSPLYYHAHPLSWWQRFLTAADLKMVPWRAVTAVESKLFIPNNALGSRIFAALNWFEEHCPRVALRLGNYPMIVLRKKG